MEIRIEYSVQQLEDTVKFIATNNKHFLGQTDKIRDTLISIMHEMAKPNANYIQGTMGFLIIADKIHEGIEFDQNVCHFEFYVDPSLSRDHTESDYEDKVIDV